MSGAEVASPALRHVTATRYVEALREGGSVPGLMEADDLGLYVVKLTGAAQGVAALVAEVVVGELARRLGFRVPDLVTVQVDLELVRLGFAQIDTFPPDVKYVPLYLAAQRVSRDAGRGRWAAPP